MNTNGITISIPIKNSIVQQSSSKNTTKKCNKINLEGHVEIKKNCLKYFFGCWIKCIHKSTGDVHSGGFLTKFEYDTIYLRSIQKPDLLDFDIHRFKFYVKNDNEQYLGMQYIELEKEKNNIQAIKNKHISKDLESKDRLLKEQIRIFNENKTKFETIQSKFFKLFEDGKVSILF